MTLSVVGRSALKRSVRREIPAVVIGEARRALAISGDELVAEMRRLAPRDQGDLIDSIGWTFGEAPPGTLVVGTLDSEIGALKITVFAGGGEAFHAKFQEFGTVNHPPTPFFFTSYRKLRRRIRGRITRAINKAIRGLSPSR